LEREWNGVRDETQSKKKEKIGRFKFNYLFYFMQYRIYNTIQCNTIQCNTIQYSAIQYNAIQYSAIQYNAIQYEKYNIITMGT
jgi:hypothetical protein